MNNLYKENDMKKFGPVEEEAMLHSSKRVARILVAKPNLTLLEIEAEFIKDCAAEGITFRSDMVRSCDSGVSTSKSRA